MKKTLLTLFFMITALSLHAQLKELTYYYDGNIISWEGKMKTLPCKEPFNIKIVNFPEGATGFTIKIYNSKDKLKDGQPEQDGEFGTYTATKTKDGFTVLIYDLLSFRRFYFVQVICTSPNVTKTVIPIYSIPPKSEISTMQFLGSVGDAMFFQKGTTSAYSNFAMVTGVKFKLRPVSLNPQITRFGLYPFQSRISFVVGAVVNELNYKSSTISSSAIGIKPTVGVDFELNRTIGITAGTVIGRQEKLPALNDKKELVFGLFVGLSFSADVFLAFKSSIPANANFPSTINSK